MLERVVSGLEFAAACALAAGSTQLHGYWSDGARYTRASRCIPRPDGSRTGTDSCAHECWQHQLFIPGEMPPIGDTVRQIASYMHSPDQRTFARQVAPVDSGVEWVTALPSGELAEWW